MKKVAPFLFRGPRPELQDLISNNIQIVINLESGIYEALHDDAYEHAEETSKHDFTVHRIPCGDIFPPTTENTIKALALARFAVTREQNVLVHCLSGKDRTGFIIAAYRMKFQDWNFGSAYEEWLSEGRHFWYFFWKYSLKKFSSQK